MPRSSKWASISTRSWWPRDSARASTRRRSRPRKLPSGRRGGRMGRTMRMEELLNEALKRKASDVHLAAGYPPILRVDGDLVPLKAAALTAKAVETMVREIAGEAHWKRFASTHEEDFAYYIDGARFRVNLHVEQGRPAFAARLIGSENPPFEDPLLSPPVRRPPQGEEG